MCAGQVLYIKRRQLKLQHIQNLFCKPSINSFSKRIIMSKAKLILSGEIGTREAFGNDRNVAESDALNRCRVQNTNSMYVVYNQPNFSDMPPPVNDEGQVIDDDSGSVVVSDTSDVSVEFNVRSFQGFDTTGIVIFEHQFYNGTAINYTRSNPDISRAFPTNEEGGASSFIVNRGVWSLYTGQNYNGTMLTLEGRSQFTPGTRIQIPNNSAPDNKIRSVRYIREN